MLSRTPKLRCIVVTLLAAWLAPAAGQSDRYSGFFEVVAADRDAAYRQAVVTVAGEALFNLVGDRAYELLSCLETWVAAELEPSGYRYLVTDPLFDFDRELRRDQWALEGSMRIDMNFLNRWVRQELAGGECAGEFRQRRTIYVETLAGDEDADPGIVDARRHIQELFSRNGYEFVEYSRRQYAQFRLVIESVETAARGSAKTMTVSGMYVDNRTDNQPYLALNATVNDRLRTTEDDLDRALFAQQAEVLLRQVREFEVSRTLPEQEVELRFVSLRRDAGLAEALLDEVAARLELPEEFVERASALDIADFDDDRIQISILIPARYRVTLTRSSMRDLNALAEDVLGFDVAASEFSEGATRLTITDADAVQTAWERDVWKHLASGAVTYPEEDSALGIVRRRLAADPGDSRALMFLEEIVSRLVQRAVRNLGQGALASANADLTLAETIGAPLEDALWASARRELDAAIDRQRERVGDGARGGDRGSRAALAVAPFVVFPEIETIATRAVRTIIDAPTAGLRGLAADADGIKRIEVNGRRVDFAAASADAAAVLSVSGASTQQFEVPGDLLGAVSEIRVVVVDGKDERTERRLTRSGDSYVADEPLRSAADDDDVLREGESSLAGNYHALIIANQDYEHWIDLHTARNDGQVLKRVLVEHYNFDPSRIHEVIDGTKEEIEREIDLLADRVRPNDSLLIYYAGHGAQDRGHGGAGYWIPVDGESEREPGHRYTWVSNDYISSYVENVKARHVLLISDSCYSGTFAQRGGGSDLFVATLEFVTRKAGLASRRAITSGDIEPVYDRLGGDVHSIFAGNLLRLLREHPAQYVTAEQLYEGLYPSVSSVVPQTPQYFVMADNDRGGDFVFVRRGAEERTAAAR